MQGREIGADSDKCDDVGKPCTTTQRPSSRFLDSETSVNVSVDVDDPCYLHTLLSVAPSKLVFVF